MLNQDQIDGPNNLYSEIKAASYSTTHLVHQIFSHL